MCNIYSKFQKEIETSLEVMEKTGLPPVWEIHVAVHLAVAGGVFDGVFLC